MKDKNTNKMEIVYVAIEKIKPYKNNPRNNKKAVGKVAKSIEKYGFKVPCVLDKNYTIITGHTRYEAAKRLGMEKIPCIIADDFSKQKVKEFRIADNQVAEFSKWDMDKLKEELAAINLEDLDFAEEFDLEGLAEDLDIDSFFEETGEEHQKKEKFEIVIRCKDAKQYDKRMKKLISIGWV